MLPQARQCPPASVLLGNGTTQATTETTTVTTDCLQPITGVSLATQDDVILAQSQIQGYQYGVSVVSGAIGAVLSRLQIAVQLTTSTADAYKDAEARITDIDVATDVATLVRKADRPAGGDCYAGPSEPTTRVLARSLCYAGCSPAPFSVEGLG